MKVGLTGGIGSGKSTVAAEFAALGALVVDADAIQREVVAPGTPGLAQIHAAFGDAVVTASGALDRAALASIVFAAPEARRRLEGITHPLIAELTMARMAAAAPGQVIVHDIPLLVELRRADDYDVVVVVDAPVEERLARLVRDRGMTREEALQRVAAQATPEERRAVADVWLENDGTADELRARVRSLWSEWAVRGLTG